jgi:hypothetical protein
VDSIRSIQLNIANKSPISNSNSSLGSNEELNELYLLTLKAGYDIDSDIFKVILDLIKLNVSPSAITKSLAKIATLKHKATNTINSQSIQSPLSSLSLSSSSK